MEKNKIRMKWIKLYAYWAENLGDDLMVEILLKRYPNFMFYTDDSLFSNRFLKFHNFKNRYFFIKKYRLLNKIFDLLTLNKKKGLFFEKLFNMFDEKCICSIYIGGSLYMQYSEEKDWIEKKIQEEEKKFRAAPLFVIGANFGSVKTTEYLNAYKNYFLKCGGVSFRDRASYSLFLGIPNIQYASDVVFNLEKEEKDFSKNSRVLISVINLREKEDIYKYVEEYEKFIVSICQYCLLSSKIPVLVSFCKKQGDEKEIERILRLIDKNDKDQIECLVYDGQNMSTVLQQFQKAEMIIATRFHAMILAILYRKKFWAISYNEKVKNVLEDIGSNRFCTLDKLDTISITKIFSEDSVSNYQSYIKKAELHFKQLDEYLESII